MNERLPQNAGEVGILNVGAGDTKLSFDPTNPAECIRAARIVKDMIRRGYALLIEVEPGKYQRALDFREDVFEYVIADFDPVTAAEADALESEQDVVQQEKSVPCPATPEGAAGKKGSRGRRAVKAASTRAVAVAPSAGG